MAATMISSIKDAHHQVDQNAREWANMIVAPQETLVRAPSTTPYLASKTRFVKAFDIPYSASTNGKFSVAAFPNALAGAAISGPAETIPSSGSAPLVVSQVPGTLPRTLAGQSYVSQGIMRIRRTSGTELGTTAFRDLGVVNIAGLGVAGLTINGSSEVPIKVTVKPQGFRGYKVGFLTLASGTYSWNYPAVQSGSTPMVFSYTPSGGGVVAISIQNVYKDAAGNYVAAATSVDVPLLDLTIEVTGSVLSGSTIANFQLVKTELVDAGHVGLQRCTAMSMLITNMASPLESGGELISARTNASILESGSYKALADAIRQLPEQEYWRSGAIADGSYSWWLPQDLESYEPEPIGTEAEDDNILVATGTLSEGGLLRVLITWIFEFYTPVQLFQRGYNSTYSEAHRDLFTLLARQPAVSANSGHMALIMAIGSLAMKVYRFYDSNRDKIDPMVAKGRKLAGKMAKTSGTQKGSNSSLVSKSKAQPLGASAKPPPVPPRPKNGFTRVAVTGKK